MNLEKEEPFSPKTFSIIEVVIDYQTLYYYLKILCDKYIEKNLAHTDIVKRFLADYTNKFLSRKERKNSN